MLDFTIFRIPVRVEPWFWLTGFLLGGGMYLRSREDIATLLIWLVVLFVSILVHELGHALTSKNITGRQPTIKLWAFGGLAYSNASLNRSQSLKVTLAGPAAGIAFFIVVWLACVFTYGVVDGTDVITWNLTRSFTASHPLMIGEGEAFIEMNPQTFYLISGLVMFNFWWSLVNLLPVFPLDGGQAYAAIERSQKKVYQVGIVTGIVTAIIGLVIFHKLFIALLFGYLSYQNYQRLKQSS